MKFVRTFHKNVQISDAQKASSNWTTLNAENCGESQRGKLRPRAFPVTGLTSSFLLETIRSVWFQKQKGNGDSLEEWLLTQIKSQKKNSHLNKCVMFISSLLAIATSFNKHTDATPFRKEKKKTLSSSSSKSEIMQIMWIAWRLWSSKFWPFFTGQPMSS